MTIIQRENPDLFEFYYGDYEGIISNYNFPTHNIDLILRASQKCINNNNNVRAFEILTYCDEYFNRKCFSSHSHIVDDNIFTWIEQHIIVDYYVNNRILTDYVIKIILRMKKIIILRFITY